MVHTGPALKENFPEIEYAVRFTHAEVIVKRGEDLFQEECDFADKDFFKMFNFKLIEGEPETVFSSQGAVVLTAALAQERKDYLVTGVAADVPSNSFLQFQILMNLK